MSQPQPQKQKWSLDDIVKAIGLINAIAAQGAAQWASIKAALAAQGYDADTAILDAGIADAERRKALALREASAPATAGELGVHAGSTGE